MTVSRATTHARDRAARDQAGGEQVAGPELGLRVRLGPPPCARARSANARTTPPTKIGAVVDSGR